MTRLAILASVAVFVASACQKGQEQSQASDSTARNLTLAPAESSGAMRDVPPPVTRPPAQRPTRTNPPAPPARPAMARLGVGTTMDIAATDTISSRAAKVGAGAAAGAVLGRILGGNKKGTIIGGIVGGLAGAGVASQTKDSDIVLPAGAHIIIRLTKELAVAAS